jgi:hypothetical protein
MVVAEEAAEPLSSHNPGVGVRRRQPIDQLILEPLVIPLPMVAVHELTDGFPKMRLAAVRQPERTPPIAAGADARREARKVAITANALVLRPRREDQTCVADQGMIYSGV